MNKEKYFTTETIKQLNPESYQEKSKKKEEPKLTVSSDSEVEKCNCNRFEGDSISCPTHELITQCPGCGCVEASREVKPLYDQRRFRCRICGLAYQINTTGEYHGY